MCQYENLKFYIKHRLIVKELLRVCKFQQSKWLGVCIEKNTVMQKQTTNDFEKNIYKLMSNACFGKRIKILRKRSKVKFLSNPQQAEAFSQRAKLKSFRIIRQDLVCVSFKNSYMVWTITTPVGASILDLSKLLLYKIHYGERVPLYSSSQLKVAYKDIDWLLYFIETPDLYNDLASFKHLLDFSEYL